MKYCVKYNKKFKYNDVIDEITITYDRKDTTILEFLQLFSNEKCRVNIYIKDEQDFLDNDCLTFFQVAKVKYPNINFALKIKDYYSHGAVNQVYEAVAAADPAIPFFFENC